MFTPGSSCLRQAKASLVQREVTAAQPLTKGLNAEKSAFLSENGQLSELFNPSVSSADSSLYTREPGRSRALVFPVVLGAIPPFFLFSQSMYLCETLDLP